MRPTQESLPLELRDRIIDDLWNDRESLASCSLVSSQWFEHARKLLFANFIAYICVKREEQAADARRFLELLEAPHSRLGLSIYRFHIVGPDTFIFMRESDRFFPEDYDVLSSLLEAIIPHLPRARELKLDSMTWNMISQDTKGLLRFPEVVSMSWLRIYLDRLDDLISFSSENYPKLKALHVEELRVKNFDQIEQSSFSRHRSRPSFLRDLKLFVEDETVPFLLALSSGTIPAQHITTLDLEVRKKDMLDPIGSLIRATAPTLSILRLWLMLYEPYPIDQDFAQVPFPISLSKNISLKLLQLYTCFIPVDIVWLEEILSSASLLCGLREIRLCYASSQVDTIFDFDFPTLERVLITQSAPDMKVVLEYEGLQKIFLPDVLMELMPELLKRGQLSVVRHEYQEHIL